MVLDDLKDQGQKFNSTGRQPFYLTKNGDFGKTGMTYSSMFTADPPLEVSEQNLPAL